MSRPLYVYASLSVCECDCAGLVKDTNSKENDVKYLIYADVCRHVSRFSLAIPVHRRA